MGIFNVGMIKKSDDVYIMTFLPGISYKIIEKPKRDGASINHIITNITDKVSNQGVPPYPTISDPDTPLITVNAKVALYETKY